jgi:5-methylcytosine-specific restriction endonuclease McrA
MGRRAIPPDTPCGYCFEDWATVWDHILPRARGGRTRQANLMPACRACNVWFADRVFPSIEAKREARRQWLRALARETARAQRGGVV